jgi:PAS domain S-box-containing protein
VSNNIPGTQVDHDRIFKAINTMARVGGWEIDLLTNSLFWTEETYRIHDLSPDEYTPHVDTAINFYTPESKAIITVALNNAAATGEGHELELELITAKGRSRSVQSYAVVTMEDGQAVKITGAFQDITEKKQSEIDLKQSEFLFRSQFDLGNMGLAITSPEKGWLKANRLLIEMLGYSSEELFELTWADLTHPQDLAADVVQFERMLAGEIEHYEMDKRFIRKNGSVLYVHLTVACYRVLDKVEFAIATLLDISRRKEAEEKLATFNSELEARVEERTAELLKSNHKLVEAQKLAEQALAAKTQFLANISHEIRTPMNGILGMVELLKLKELDDEDKQYLQVIQRSGNTLLSVINDVLDYSKLGVDKLELELEPFDLAELLTETLASYRAIVSEKVEIELSVDPLLTDRRIKGDAVRLHQILSNLLNNACKFTEQGMVRVVVESELQHNNSCLVHFSVTDTGIGIDASHHDCLFKPFTQANRLHGGTGLGLSICSHLLSLMNSKLLLKSTLGEGAEFSFSIDFELTEQRVEIQEIEQLAIEKGSVKILLVEDNAVNQLVSTKLLESQGAIVETVNDGAEAVDRIVQQNKKYDLVLMDCEMPTMDGYEATRNIRRWESKEGMVKTTIYALTAHALPEHIRLCTDAGMDGHLSKPVKLSAFKELLQKIP